MFDKVYADTLLFQNTCLWRRALLLAFELDVFEPWEFSETLGVDSCMTNKLLKRLEKEKFASVDDKSEGYWIFIAVFLNFEIMLCCH